MQFDANVDGRTANPATAQLSELPVGKPTLEQSPERGHPTQKVPPLGRRPSTKGQLQLRTPPTGAVMAMNFASLKKECYELRTEFQAIADGLRESKRMLETRLTTVIPVVQQTTLPPGRPKLEENTAVRVVAQQAAVASAGPFTNAPQKLSPPPTSGEKARRAGKRQGFKAASKTGRRKIRTHAKSPSKLWFEMSAEDGSEMNEMVMNRIGQNSEAVSSSLALAAFMFT